jgi:hypothetical protein
MKYFLIIFVVLCQTYFVCLAQEDDKSVPAITNIAGTEYPKVLPDLRVKFRTRAPNAKSMQINLGKTYDMVKDDQGVWSVTTDPQVPGFHYYSLVIDGLAVADPASESFYGTGRMSSAIDIPEAGVDFYTIKNVPHGEISSIFQRQPERGGDLIYILPQDTLNRAKNNILSFIYSMEVVRMKEDGRFRERQISYLII